jgi:Protein of unknown function (DUF2637)
MEKLKAFVRAATGDLLWAVILVPILAISWIGFYTIARAVGIPPVFAAGMSAAFDGVALFAARIGLKHRRKGFSGWLARFTVVAFAALGAFVQSFHSETHAWVQAHSWIVWATAPVAACLAYELHLGWVHRKQLIRKGYHHPSAKSGFGPATWIHFPGETWSEYRTVLRARRTFIAKGNLERFALEEAEQPAQKARPSKPVKPSKTEPDEEVAEDVHDESDEQEHRVPKRPRTRERKLHSVPNRPTGRSSSRPASRAAKTENMVVQDWCREHGFELGYNNRVPIAGLRAYRRAQAQQAAS